MIINSVEPTLKYYLRMMKNPDNFLSHYIESVEKEIAIKFEHKQAWNDIVMKEQHSRRKISSKIHTYKVSYTLIVNNLIDAPTLNAQMNDPLS